MIWRYQYWHPSLTGSENKIACHCLDKCMNHLVWPNFGINRAPGVSTLVSLALNKGLFFCWSQATHLTSLHWWRIEQARVPRPGIEPRASDRLSTERTALVYVLWHWTDPISLSSSVSIIMVDRQILCTYELDTLVFEADNLRVQFRESSGGDGLNFKRDTASAASVLQWWVFEKQIQKER